jgi:hypothetical protein
MEAVREPRLIELQPRKALVQVGRVPALIANCSSRAHFAALQAGPCSPAPLTPTRGDGTLQHSIPLQQLVHSSSSFRIGCHNRVPDFVPHGELKTECDSCDVRHSHYRAPRAKFTYGLQGLPHTGNGRTSMAGFLRQFGRSKATRRIA